MRTRLSILSAAVFTAFLASTAQGANTVTSAVVEKNWFEDKIRWTVGPPSYKYRWKAKIQNGFVVLCGAGTFLGANRSETKKLLKDIGFYVDETLYLKDISFFAKIGRNTNLVGAKANCMSTGKRPPKQIKDGVSLRNTRRNRLY